MINRSPLLDVEPDIQSASDSDSIADSLTKKFFHVLFFRTDWLLILPMLVLLAVGEMFIYGTGQQAGGFAASTFWKRHLVYMAVGGGFWLFFSILDYRWCGPFSVIFYPFALVRLVAVL